MKILVPAILFFLFVIAAACGGAEKPKSDIANVSIEVGEKIFMQYCVLCHGADGKLGINGAKDITVSKLTFDERVVLITNGKLIMTPFEGILSEDEIKAAAKYSMELE